MKKYMTAGVALFGFVTSMYADNNSQSSTPGNTVNVEVNENGSSTTQSTPKIPPILWTIPGWYYGHWFDTPEEYNSWTENNYYQPNAAAQQNRIDNRSGNQQNRIDNHGTNQQDRINNRGTNQQNRSTAKQGRQGNRSGKRGDRDKDRD